MCMLAERRCNRLAGDIKEMKGHIVVTGSMVSIYYGNLHFAGKRIRSSLGGSGEQFVTLAN